MMALMAIPFAMQAQTKFHDVELNEATGPVKSITQAGMMGRGEQVINFTQEGKMQAEGLSGLVYDDNGYLQKAERSVETPQGNMKITTTYKWENGKVQSQSMDFGQGSMTQVFKYNEKGAPASMSMRSAALPAAPALMPVSTAPENIRMIRRHFSQILLPGSPSPCWSRRHFRRIIRRNMRGCSAG